MIGGRHRRLGERKDAHTEFFHLLVVAYKINNVKVFPHIITIDADKLYSEAKREGKTFNQWPKWVDHQLTKVMLKRYDNLIEASARILTPDFQVMGNFYHK